MSTTYARTINGNTIYAALSDADSAGNSITTTYATKTEVGQVRQLPASTSSDEDKVLTVNSSGTPEWATPATVTVDQTYDASSTNAQSGTAVAGALTTVSQVPAVTSSDNGKLLRAAYIMGNPEYYWEDMSGAFVPASTSVDADKVLTVDAQGSPAWATMAIPVIGTITLNDPQDSQNNDDGGDVEDPTIDG